MAFATVAFVVRQGATVDVRLEGVPHGEKLFGLRWNDETRQLEKYGVVALTVGTTIRRDLTPGVYFVTSENTIKYSIVSGETEAFAKAGKDPWPDPPPPPPDKATFATKVKRATWNEAFQNLVGPVADIDERLWLTVTSTLVGAEADNVAAAKDDATEGY